MANANFHWFSFPITMLLHPRFSFQHESMAILKAFMHGHSCVMTFLYLKVQNG